MTDKWEDTWERAEERERRERDIGETPICGFCTCCGQPVLLDDQWVKIEMWHGVALMRAGEYHFPCARQRFAAWAEVRQA